MSTHSPELAPVAYEYINRATDPTAEATDDDRRSWVDPSVCVDDYGTELVDRLLAAERHPGEAFEAVLSPAPGRIAPAFVADIGVDPDDIVGVAAPSTQLCDDFFYAMYAAMTETGAVVATKYPRREVRRRLPEVDPLVVDLTPGAQTDGGVDVSATDARPVSCGDLTSLGVAAERATTRLAASERPATFAIATMTQLLTHHDAAVLDRFLHELVGQWRNQGVGGLVHVPPADDADGLDCFGSAHFDYRIETRVADGAVEARACGKRDVAPVWRTVGTTSDADAAVTTGVSDGPSLEPTAADDAFTPE